MCDKSRFADVVQLPVRELLALAHEHPDQFAADPVNYPEPVVKIRAQLIRPDGGDSLAAFFSTREEALKWVDYYLRSTTFAGYTFNLITTVL